MRKLFLLTSIVLTGLHFTASAQDETVKKLKTEADKFIKKEEDTLNRVWRKGGLFSLNLAQGSLNNWAAGGDEFSLSLNNLVSVYAYYKEGRRSWDNTFDFNLGYLRTTSLGGRKNDDRIDLLSKYGYAVSDHWSLSGLFNFRSQLLKGYTYTDNKRTFASTFLSPAYVLLSAGMDYKPNKEFSLFLSPVTARWVIVKDDSLSARGLYGGVDSGRHVRTEVGAFLTANYNHAFNKVLGYKGRVDLFSNYRKDPQYVDVFFTNLFSVKLSRVLSATWNLDLLYDRDVRLFGKDKQSPAVQLKSLFGAGLLVKW